MNLLNNFMLDCRLVLFFRSFPDYIVHSLWSAEAFLQTFQASKQVGKSQSINSASETNLQHIQPHLSVLHWHIYCSLRLGMISIFCTGILTHSMSHFITRQRYHTDHREVNLPWRWRRSRRLIVCAIAAYVM